MKTTLRYLDTSLLLPYYYPEATSDAVERLLISAAPVAISPLVELEFGCVLARKTRAGDLRESAARRILAAFHAHLRESRYAMLPVQAAEYQRANRWIQDLSTTLRSLDALHLAVAHNHRCTLLTADKALAQAARHYGVRYLLA